MLNNMMEYNLNMFNTFWSDGYFACSIGEASPEAKQRVKEFMLKVNMAKSLEEVQKVIFDVVDYALEIAQNTNGLN